MGPQSRGNPGFIRKVFQKAVWLFGLINILCIYYYRLPLPNQNRKKKERESKENNSVIPNIYKIKYYQDVMEFSFPKCGQDQTLLNLISSYNHYSQTLG